jgi:acetyl esterase/lipase
MSFRGWIIKKVLKANMNHSMDYDAKRKDFGKIGEKFKVPKTVICEISEISGVPVEWVYPAGERIDKAVIFLHGGSYCIGSAAAYRPFIVGLAEKIKLPVLSIEYRLAPEHPFPAALNDVKSVYEGLLNVGLDSDDIVLLGDSAGGGLALATTMFLRDSQISMPKAIALLSPWTDLTMSSESCVQKADVDPINSYDFDKMCAMDYAGSEALTNCLISPLYGDYIDVPPIFIHSGTEDIGRDDSIRTAEKAKEAGVDVTFKLWEGMFHDFTVFYMLTPEGKQSFNKLVDFIRNHLLPME